MVIRLIFVQELRVIVLNVIVVGVATFITHIY
jgi:hypothetical protein